MNFFTRFTGRATHERALPASMRSRLGELRSYSKAGDPSAADALTKLSYWTTTIADTGKALRAADTRLVRKHRRAFKVRLTQEAIDLISAESSDRARGDRAAYTEADARLRDMKVDIRVEVFIDAAAYATHTWFHNSVLLPGDGMEWVDPAARDKAIAALPELLPGLEQLAASVADWCALADQALIAAREYAALDMPAQRRANHQLNEALEKLHTPELAALASEIGTDIQHRRTAIARAASRKPLG